MEMLRNRAFGVQPAQEAEAGLMEEYHKLIESSINHVAGSNKSLRDSLRRAQVSGQVPLQPKSLGKKLSVPDLSLALAKTTDSAFELLCRQEMYWYSKYAEISRQCQAEFDSVEVKHAQEARLLDERHQIDLKRWRAEVQTTKDQIAKLEEQLRALGAAFPPAVTVVDDDASRTPSLTGVASAALADGESDAEGEAAMFENSWVESSDAPYEARQSGEIGLAHAGSDFNGTNMRTAMTLPSNADNDGAASVNEPSTDTHAENDLQIKAGHASFETMAPEPRAPGMGKKNTKRRISSSSKSVHGGRSTEGDHRNAAVKSEQTLGRTTSPDEIANDKSSSSSDAFEDVAM